MHCLGLFERYGSIKDGKRRIDSKKITPKENDTRLQLHAPASLYLPRTMKGWAAFSFATHPLRANVVCTVVMRRKKFQAVSTHCVWVCWTAMIQEKTRGRIKTIRTIVTAATASLRTCLPRRRLPRLPPATAPRRGRPRSTAPPACCIGCRRSVATWCRRSICFVPTKCNTWWH